MITVGQVALFLTGTIVLIRAADASLLVTLVVVGSLVFSGYLFGLDFAREFPSKKSVREGKR